MRPSGGSPLAPRPPDAISRVLSRGLCAALTAGFTPRRGADLTDTLEDTKEMVSKMPALLQALIWAPPDLARSRPISTSLARSRPQPRPRPLPILPILTRSRPISLQALMGLTVVFDCGWIKPVYLGPFGPLLHDVVGGLAGLAMTLVVCGGVGILFIGCGLIPLQVTPHSPRHDLAMTSPWPSPRLIPGRSTAAAWASSPAAPRAAAAAARPQSEASRRAPPPPPVSALSPLASPSAAV